MAADFQVYETHPNSRGTMEGGILISKASDLEGLTL